MNTGTPARSRGARRILWLAAGIVVAIGLYTAGWFYIGGALEAQTRQALDELAQSGRRAGCEDAEARGYPFRIGLFCQSVLYEDATAGVSASAGMFRSAAQVYQPSRVIGELDGPARLELPGLIPLELRWERLRASARLADPLPQRASFEIVEARIAGADGGAGLFASMARGEGHMRTRGPDLDVAFRFSGLRAAPAPSASPLPVDLFADATLSEGVLWAGDPSGSLRGRSAVLRSFTISAGETLLAEASGPVSVGADGLIEARFDLELREPAKLAQVLKSALPDAAAYIESLMVGIAATAQPGEPARLPLIIDKGRPTIGFLTLGQLPPLP